MPHPVYAPLGLISSLVLCGLLSACEPTPPQPKLGSVPVAPESTLPRPAETGAVQGLGTDAATVADSSQAAPAAPLVPSPSADHASKLGPVAQSELVALRGYIGSYPSDSVSFLEEGPLATRLKRMLGTQYPTLLANLRTVGPLTEDGSRWFITGNRPHEGGLEAAAIVVDAAQDAVRVWMLHEGQQQEFIDPAQARIEWPQEVQTLQRNTLGDKG